EHCAGAARIGHELLGRRFAVAQRNRLGWWLLLLPATLSFDIDGKRSCCGCNGQCEEMPAIHAGTFIDMGFVCAHCAFLAPMIAMHSISTRALFARPLTATAERVGRCFVKYVW